MAQHLNVIPRKHLYDQLGISRNTIKRWIEYRGFPKPLKASGQKPLFDRDAVNLWFEKMEAGLIHCLAISSTPGSSMCDGSNLM